MAQVTIDVGKIVGKGYGAFWNSRHRYRVVKGGKGSKKSTTAALWYIVNMMKYPDSNLLVVRSTFNTHRDSTFAILKWAIKELGVSQYWKATTNPLELKYIPTGQKIIFKGLDDWQKLASTTMESGYLCWVWIEEAFEIFSENDFDKLEASVARSKLPKPLFNQFTLTFNPWSEKHWLKKRFFDIPDENTFTLTTTYECNEHLDLTYKEHYEKMKIQNPRRYAIEALGNWGISEGLIFENWTVEAFDKNNIGGDQAWKYRKVYGLDHGYNDPEAFIALSVNPLDKILYIYDEHYETEMSIDEIILMLTQKGVVKERIRVDGGGSAKTINEELKRKGVTRLMKADKGNGSVMSSIRVLQDYKIIVHPSCKNTISELSSYVFDDKNDTPQDKPVDKANHLMDAMRYAMEDIIFFKPEKGEVTEQRYKKLQKLSLYSGADSILPSDFMGGWG